VGLAPGRQGANRTGRPFTGDFAGVLLYETLLKLGFARGRYQARPDDGLELVDCMITNAVRCAPPGNKPLPEEEATCRPFLTARIGSLPRLKVIVTLGDVARRNVLRALGMRASAGAAGHGVEVEAAGYRLINSYHCSRLNTNTGRLTPEMFEAVFAKARKMLDD
jgi:uracil-DNA glycosylase family 4